MAIDITNLDIQDEFGNAITDFANCNIGDKLTITYDVEVKEYANASQSNNMTINYTNGVITGGGYWLYDPLGQFGNFRIGDVLERKDNVLNNTLNATVNIVDKVDNFLIKVDTDMGGGVNDVATSGSIFNLKTPITAMKYFYNFIENSEGLTYASKVDGTIQQLLASSILATQTQTSGTLTIGQKYYISDFNAGDDFTNVGGSNVTGTLFTATGTTPTTYTNGSTLNKAYDMEFQGAKPYQIGSATIVCMGLNTTIIYGQKFKIIHNTFFTPFFLSEQWSDLLSGINADYYQNSNCLKHIFKLEAMYNYNDPNRILTYENVLDNNLNYSGNTGGFGENFNTGLTNYSVDSVVYQRADASVIDAIELTTAETDFTIVIQNTADTPFSNNNTKFTVNFIRAPYDESEYQSNTKTLAENFAFDRVHNTVGSAAANGDNYGTDWQVLKSVEATYDSTSQITITGKIAFDANVITEISASQEYRYLLFVAVQDHTKTSLNSDRVTLLADIDNFYVDATDDGMIVGENRFLIHPYTDIETEYFPELPRTCVEDEVVAQHIFYIDTVGRETDTIVITSIEARVKALNTTNSEEFTLDTYSINTANLPTIGGYQYIDLDVPRVFHIPTTEIRKNIQVNRRTDLDNAGKIYYEMIFPFMVRWEYWIALATANADFFDIAEANNGLNQEWFRYANSTIDDWNTYVEFTVNAKKNGTPLSYTSSQVFQIQNYAGEVNDKILTYDSSNVELTNVSIPKKYILGYEDTKVVATFTALPSGFSVNDCCVVIGIETYEEGGIVGRRSFSSANVRTTDTWFKTTDVTGLVDLAVASATSLTATCKIDKTLIPLNKNKYSISARLYYLPDNSYAKETEEGVVKITEDGVLKGIE